MPNADAVKLAARDAHISTSNTGNSTSFEYPDLALSTTDQPAKPVDENSKHVLVIGSGVSGLYVAWMLLDKGYRVTILADDWAWNNDFTKSRMTSQIAGALWEFPPGGCGLTEIESPGPGWAGIEHYREWALQSHEFYKGYSNLSNPHEATGHSFGLSFTDLHQFFYTDLTVEGEDVNHEEYMKLQAIELAAEEGRMGTPTVYNEDDMKKKFKGIIETDKTFQGQTLRSAYSHSTPVINTDKAMAYLMALVKAKGANMETRKFTQPLKTVGEQLLKDLSADAIVNATGLGAKELAEDDDVYPVRGAVRRVENTRRGQFRHLNEAYLVPAQLDSNKHPTKTVFIVPRNDDVLYVGSIIQPNHYDKTLSPDSPEVQIMWDRAGEFMPRLRHAGFFPGYTFAQGLRPFTKRNAKVRADEGADFPLVHNYGHGGSGWTLGIGTARCVVIILEDLLQELDERIGPKVELVRQNVLRLSNVVEDLDQIFARIENSGNSTKNVSKDLDKATTKLDLSKKIVKKTLVPLKSLKEPLPSLSLRGSFEKSAPNEEILDTVLNHISTKINDAINALPRQDSNNSDRDKIEINKAKERVKEAKELVKKARGMLKNAEDACHLQKVLDDVVTYDTAKRQERAIAIQKRAKTINAKIYGDSSKSQTRMNGSTAAAG